MGKFKGHPWNVEGVPVTRWRSLCDWACLSIVFLIKRRNRHHFIYSSIQLSIHPSFHLVFSTSRWSAGTLCPLKSTQTQTPKHGKPKSAKLSVLPHVQDTSCHMCLSHKQEQQRPNRQEKSRKDSKQYSENKRFSWTAVINSSANGIHSANTA